MPSGRESERWRGKGWRGERGGDVSGTMCHVERGKLKRNGGISDKRHRRSLFRENDSTSKKINIAR